MKKTKLPHKIGGVHPFEIAQLETVNGVNIKRPKESTKAFVMRTMGLTSHQYDLAYNRMARAIKKYESVFEVEPADHRNTSKEMEYIAKYSHLTKGKNRKPIKSGIFKGMTGIKQPVKTKRTQSTPIREFITNMGSGNVIDIKLEFAINHSMYNMIHKNSAAMKVVRAYRAGKITAKECLDRLDGIANDIRAWHKRYDGDSYCGSDAPEGFADSDAFKEFIESSGK